MTACLKSDKATRMGLYFVAPVVIYALCQAYPQAMTVLLAIYLWQVARSWW